jgi:hypothetical protein
VGLPVEEPVDVAVVCLDPFEVNPWSETAS